MHPLTTTVKILQTPDSRIIATTIILSMANMDKTVMFGLTPINIERKEAHLTTTA